MKRDREALEAVIHTPAGPVTSVAGLTVIDRRLILNEVHVSGKGLTIARIRQVAKVLGAVEDESVVEVIIQDGARSSGARPGIVPIATRVQGEVMTTIHGSGWNVGFDKVKFTLLLKSELNYSLTEAKKVTDAIMASESLELQVDDAQVEEIVSSSMRMLGARCGAVVAHG